MSRLGAVVVTHASAEALPDLLANLSNHEPEMEVVVVDSGSPDGAPEVPAGVELVLLDENVGFGAACNRGAERLLDRGVEAVVCLNPDVRLHGPSFTQLAAQLQQRPRVGIATGPVVDLDGARVPAAWGPTSSLRAFWFATGWRLPRLRGLVGRVRSGGALTSGATTARDDLVVDGHVLGGTMIVRTDLWRSLGGFDERFFLYWEDADLCQRARAAGWEVRVLPCDPIVHAAGTSSAGVAVDQRWAWYVEGARRFAQVHLDRGEAARMMRALRYGRSLGRLRRPRDQRVR